MPEFAQSSVFVFHTGGMRLINVRYITLSFVHLGNIILPKDNVREEYDFSWVNKSSYLPKIHAINMINCLSYRRKSRIQIYLQVRVHIILYYHTKRYFIYCLFGAARAIFQLSGGC
jgi:hypothetical protein